MYLSSISLFAIKQIVMAIKVTRNNRTGLRAKKASMEVPEALDVDSSHVMPSTRTSAYPTQLLPYLASCQPPPLRRGLPQFQSSTPLHFIANSLKAKRSIPL